MTEAIKLHRRGAELGDAVAQYNLAVFYANGDGLEANTAEAFALYEKAAANGYELAKIAVQEIKALRRVGFELADSQYTQILFYFCRNPLGTELPVLTLLSILPLSARRAILEILLELFPFNAEVYNKLSLVYLKGGKQAKAHELLHKGLISGAIDKQTFEELEEKTAKLFADLHRFPKPSESYAESKSVLKSEQYARLEEGQYAEFYELLLHLCEQELPEETPIWLF